MKFIHCSDIHLDSKMERNLSAAQARERNAEICATFERLVQFARREGVRAVLIAGDLFDTARASTQTAGFLLNLVSNAPEVDFLYLRGNHDEADRIFEGLQIPENFKTFGSRWTSCRYENVVVSGMEPENWETFYDDLKLGGEDINIVMLHGQVDTRSGEELICLPRLKNKNIRYLALGHLHSFQLERLDEDGVYCYCGCLEGRGFDECGEKGFVLLETEENDVRAEFIPFACRTLHETYVDITGLQTVSQILEAVRAAGEGISEKDLVKFTLTGGFTPETQKDLRFLKKMLESRCYFVKIKDESTLQISKEDYEHDASLKGEFVRLVMASDRPREEKERMILWGIRALSGEEVAP